MSTLEKIFEATGEALKSLLLALKPEDLNGLTVTERASLKAILERQWNDLQDEPANVSTKDLNEWKAKRSYAFELITFKLLALEGLDPSLPYYVSPPRQGEDGSAGTRRSGRQPGGEQIDGAFVLDGRDFLVESKWQGPIASADMYVFRGRVEGKLVGTIGVFISAEGFVKDAEYTLISGKELNVLLVDGEDVGLALEPRNSFRTMLRAKLRQAALMGRAFYSYAEFLDVSRR
jgi:hypothetical protein